MNEAVKFALERKIEFVSTAASASMTWWVSSVVFCGTILAGVWLKRGQIREPPVVVVLGSALLIFFTTVVAFGLLVVRYIDRVELEIADQAARLAMPHDFFASELSTFKWAMIAGTSSFGIILVVWCGVSIRLWRDRERRGPTRGTSPSDKEPIIE